ncbi:MAG: hypothetical protein RLZZ552_916 [Verrucomicrobiota bacterium]|jgi:hypothetical protein
MNKFSFLLVALCVSLHAQDAKPAGTKAAAPEVKLSGGAQSAPKTYFADVWVGRSISDCLTFQNNIQVLAKQVEELKRLQIFLENALTTPEKEARGHEIAAKQAKLKGDNESMGKLYGGFSIDRPYQLVFTKAIIATPLSNEEFTKLTSAKDFKSDTILSLGDKKFQIRNTVAGQAEVETFGLSLKRITDAKSQLQQLVDLQPRLTKDEDKAKVEKAIKDLQDDLSKNLEEFKKSHGFDFNAEAITLPAEAKLSVQITEDEKKAIEAKAVTSGEKK